MHFYEVRPRRDKGVEPEYLPAVEGRYFVRQFYTAMTVFQIMLDYRENTRAHELPMKMRVRSNQIKSEYSLSSDAIEALYQLS
jgi:hypothetical protein